MKRQVNNDSRYIGDIQPPGKIEQGRVVENEASSFVHAQTHAQTLTNIEMR
jgi:hypothetical protein